MVATTCCDWRNEKHHHALYYQPLSYRAALGGPVLCLIYHRDIA